MNDLYLCDAFQIPIGEWASANFQHCMHMYVVQHVDVLVHVYKPTACYPSYSLVKFLYHQTLILLCNALILMFY